MFDTATGKYLPVRFYDFIHKKWSDGPPAANLEIPEGNYDPVLGATYLANRAAGMVAAEIAEWRRRQFRSPRRWQRPITATVRWWPANG